VCAVDNGKSYVLSVALAIGDVLLMSNYDDICPKVIHTSLAGRLLLTAKCPSSISVMLDQRFSWSAVFHAVVQNFEARNGTLCTSVVPRVYDLFAVLSF